MVDPEEYDLLHFMDLKYSDGRFLLQQTKKRHDTY